MNLSVDLSVDLSAVLLVNGCKLSSKSVALRLSAALSEKSTSVYAVVRETTLS